MKPEPIPEFDVVGSGTLDLDKSVAQQRPAPALRPTVARPGARGEYQPQIERLMAREPLRWWTHRELGAAVGLPESSLRQVVRAMRHAGRLEAQVITNPTKAGALLVVRGRRDDGDTAVHESDESVR